jgi:hypothetical protein
VHQARHVGGAEKGGRNVPFSDEPIMAASSECLIFFDVGWDDRLTVAQLMLSVTSHATCCHGLGDAATFRPGYGAYGAPCQPELKVLFLSGYARCGEVGDIWPQKPFTTRTLAEAVSRALQ